MGVLHLSVHKEEAVAEGGLSEGPKRDFAGVGGGVKHGFGDKCLTHCDSVGAPDEGIAEPDFDAVGLSAFMEFAVDADDVGGDPVFSDGATAGDHDAFEGGVEADFEGSGAGAAAKRAGDVELVGEEDGAVIGDIELDRGVELAAHDEAALQGDHTDDVGSEF